MSAVVNGSISTIINLMSPNKPIMKTTGCLNTFYVKNDLNNLNPYQSGFTPKVATIIQLTILQCIILFVKLSWETVFFDTIPFCFF